MMNLNHKARPTTYNGIRMRSRLEAGYAAWMDRQGWSWQYEPQVFASGRGQYLPDFRIEGARHHGKGYSKVVYVEIKPTWADLVSQEVPERMAIVLDSEPDAMLVCQAPGIPEFSWNDHDGMVMQDQAWGVSFTLWDEPFPQPDNGIPSWRWPGISPDPFCWESGYGATPSYWWDYSPDGVPNGEICPSPWLGKWWEVR